MIRRAAWRAVGLTELPAAQRKRSRLHGRAAPFRGRTAPEAEGVVTARGEPGAQVGGRSTRRGALAPGAGASERAAAAVAHVARAGQRPHPRTAPAGSGGRREIFPGGRRRRVRGAVGARRGAGGAIRGDAGAAGLPGPYRTRALDIAHIVKMRGLRSARAARGGVFAALGSASHPSQAYWPSIAPATSMNGAAVGARGA